MDLQTIFKLGQMMTREGDAVTSQFETILEEEVVDADELLDMEARGDLNRNAVVLIGRILRDMAEASTHNGHKAVAQRAARLADLIDSFLSTDPADEN